MEVEFLVGNRWQRPDILVKVDHQLEMSIVRNEDGADRDDGLAGDDDDTEKADEYIKPHHANDDEAEEEELKPVGREGYPLQRAALRRASLCLGGWVVDWVVQIMITIVSLMTRMMMIENVLV